LVFLIIFIEIKTTLLQEFNLHINEFVNSKFKITYKEIISDLDYDEFIIYKIEYLKIDKIVYLAICYARITY
jgi:hypothetical protein